MRTTHCKPFCLMHAGYSLYRVPIACAMHLGTRDAPLTERPTQQGTPSDGATWCSRRAAQAGWRAAGMSPHVEQRVAEGVLGDNDALGAPTKDHADHEWGRSGP
jgi:hypothetical protein